MNAGDMEKLAKMAAKEAVSETFLTLGMKHFQSDFGSRRIRLPAKSSLRGAPRSQRCHCRRTRCSSEWRRVGVLGRLQGHRCGAFVEHILVGTLSNLS